MWDNPVPEEKSKCYVFKAKVCATIEGYVWAETREEAEELINQKDYDELEHICIDEICDIEEMRED